MYPIDQPPASKEFGDAWLAAASHLVGKGGDAVAWIRTTLEPPLLEHLSFRLGNQLVSVFVVGQGVTGPSSREAFEAFAEQANAVPCLLQMKRTPDGFAPRLDGWGLIHSITLERYDPVASISDARIPVAAWERHDMALQVVRHDLESEGCRIDTWQPNREVFPSLWFERDGGRYWVVVSAYGAPDRTAPRPGVMDKLKRDLQAHSQSGFFAPVAIFGVNDDEEPDRDAPLYRGRAFAVECDGLEPV